MRWTVFFADAPWIFRLTRQAVAAPIYSAQHLRSINQFYSAALASAPVKRPNEWPKAVAASRRLSPLWMKSILANGPAEFLKVFMPITAGGVGTKREHIAARRAASAL